MLRACIAIVLLAMTACCEPRQPRTNPASWKPLAYYRTEATLSRIQLASLATCEVLGLVVDDHYGKAGENLAVQVFGNPPSPQNYITAQIAQAAANPMTKLKGPLTEDEKRRLESVFRILYVERNWSSRGEAVDPLAKIAPEVPPTPASEPPPPTIIDSRPLMGSVIHLRDVEQPSRWSQVADGSFTGVYADNQRTAIAWGPAGSALTVDGGATWTKRDWPAGQGPISGLVLEGGTIVLLTEDGELVAPTGFSYSSAADLPLVKRIDRTDHGLLLAQTKTKVIALKQTSPQVFAVAWTVEGQLYGALATSCLVKTSNGSLSTLSADGLLSPNPEHMPPSPMLPQGWQPTTTVPQTAPEQKGLLVDATGAQYSGDRWIPLDSQRPCLLLSHGGGVALALYADGQPLLHVNDQRHKATDSLPDGTTSVAPLAAVLVAATQSGLFKTPRLAD